MEKIVKHVKKQRDDMRNIIAYLEALSGTESAMESGLEPRQHPPSACAIRHHTVTHSCRWKVYTTHWDTGDDSIRFDAHIQAVTTK